MNEDRETEQVSSAVESVWEAVAALRGDGETALEALALCLYNTCMYHGVEYEELAKRITGVWMDMEMARHKCTGTVAR